jgi:hypothetical protein
LLRSTTMASAITFCARISKSACMLRFGVNTVTHGPNNRQIHVKLCVSSHQNAPYFVYVFVHTYVLHMCIAVNTHQTLTEYNTHQTECDFTIFSPVFVLWGCQPRLQIYMAGHKNVDSYVHEYGCSATCTTPPWPLGASKCTLCTL